MSGCRESLRGPHSRRKWLLSIRACSPKAAALDFHIQTILMSYSSYEWHSSSVSNGKSGEGLTDAIVATVRKLPGVRKVCDLGCGNGYIVGQLAKSGFSVTGVDASESGVEIASRTYPAADFRCALIGDDLTGVLPLSDFDLVISSDVIEHLYRPADLVEAASALLKPRGHLLICTPYHGYLKNLALSVTGRMDEHFTALWDGGHIKFFSVGTLSELIEENGFTDLSFSYYGRAPYLWKNMICHARKRGDAGHA